jgi:hypothetical protein
VTARPRRFAEIACRRNPLVDLLSYGPIELFLVHQRLVAGRDVQPRRAPSCPRKGRTTRLHPAENWSHQPGHETPPAPIRRRRSKQRPAERSAEQPERMAAQGNQHDNQAQNHERDAKVHGIGPKN